MERAQDTFKRMMQGEIAPALRELGLKGSGQTFEIPSDSHWALIGFQKSAWGDSEEVRFTINLTVVEKAAWASSRREEPSMGERRPAPNSHYGAPTWQDRIGSLLADGEDLWWCVPAGRPTASTAREVVAAIRDCALPEMRLQIADDPRARPAR